MLVEGAPDRRLHLVGVEGAGVHPVDADAPRRELADDQLVVAERELGFRPQYRIGLARGGDGGLRLETARG